MAHTFEELVTMQRAADQAHAEVQRIQTEYGRQSDREWTEDQRAQWEQAWQAWGERTRQVQGAITGHAKAEGRPRHEAEADVKKTARHPEG